MPRTATSQQFVSDGDGPDLSIVVPLYDEEAVVPILVERLGRVLDGMGVNAKVLLVDDGSRDGTWGEIARAHARDSRFLGLSLSRNFGHQAAISAGLEGVAIGGGAVVVMDGDLQDPPEAIAALWSKFREGWDVVYAIRASRPEPFWKRLAYSSYYRILGRSGTIPIPRDAGDFSIMSRRVVDHLNALPERRRFVRGLRAWVGFRQVGLPIDRAARLSGRPKFTPGKLLGLALDGLVGFSEAPLQWSGVLGAAALATALTGLVAASIRAVLGLSGLAGWAWVALLALFLGGAQLLSVAVMGEYLTRILHEVHGRPPYIVRRTLGLSREQSTRKPQPARRRAG